MRDIVSPVTLTLCTRSSRSPVGTPRSPFKICTPHGAAHTRVNRFTNDGLRFHAPSAVDVPQPPVGQQRRRRMRRRENVNGASALAASGDLGVGSEHCEDDSGDV